MAPAPPPGRIPRLCARLAPPVAQDDFRADVFFPGSTFSDGLRFVAEHIFGVKDWDGELQRLTSDSGFTHEQAANIPKHVFATGTRSEWLPGLTILRKAIVRRLATFVFPPALADVISHVLRTCDVNVSFFKCSFLDVFMSLRS